MAFEIYREIFSLYQEIDKYFLTADRIMLDIEYIFVNTFSETINFIYMPSWEKDFSRQVISLTEKLMQKAEHRDEKAKKFIPLSNASAGQKTTTILTFLLAYGSQPLLLDQPEDDLDNRLVYDLIVARLKVAKSKRQIIVVTHNANIPVNGDSEYIVSMDSETNIIQVNQTGTMDDKSIRQEICDVMEGTKDAFEMRAKKYHFNIKE